MDYNRLYEIWKREKKTRELQRLDKQFYIELKEYVKELKGDIQLLDEKTLMARLAHEEIENTNKIVTDLIQTRYRKVSKAVFVEKSISPDCLTHEENVIYNSALSTMNEVKSLILSVLRGHIPYFREVKEKPKSILIRFLQAIPAIVGPNMKTYGPFEADDIASLPIENAESLIKRGVAVKVEVR